MRSAVWCAMPPDTRSSLPHNCMSGGWMLCKFAGRKTWEIFSPRRKTSSRTLLRISSAARRKQFLRQPELPDLPSVSISPTMSWNIRPVTKLLLSGKTACDRVVCTFDAGYWVSSWVTFLACKELGVFCSAIGKPQPRELDSRMGIYRYNVIVADPTWLVSLSEIAEKVGTFPLKFIMAAGDRMTDVYRNYVQDVWKAPVILGYGSTEAGGGLGMECRRGRGYHVDEFNFLFEIIQPDREGYGELVMTTLSRRTEPFIRYRVRDVTRFLEEPCPCGAPLRRIDMI